MQNKQQRAWPIGGTTVEDTGCMRWEIRSSSKESGSMVRTLWESNYWKRSQRKSNFIKGIINLFERLQSYHVIFLPNYKNEASSLCSQSHMKKGPPPKYECIVYLTNTMAPGQHHSTVKYLVKMIKDKKSCIHHHSKWL